MELEDVGGCAGKLVISRQMSNDMLVPLLAARSHGDSAKTGGGGGPVLAVGETAENRLPDDTKQMGMKEVVGLGENNKVKQYKNTIPPGRKKKKKKNSTLLFLQLFVIADVVHEVCDS